MLAVSDDLLACLVVICQDINQSSVSNQAFTINTRELGWSKISVTPWRCNGNQYWANIYNQRLAVFVRWFSRGHQNLHWSDNDYGHKLMAGLAWYSDGWSFAIHLMSPWGLVRHCRGSVRSVGQDLIKSDTSDAMRWCRLTSDSAPSLQPVSSRADTMPGGGGEREREREDTHTTGSACPSGSHYGQARYMMTLGQLQYGCGMAAAGVAKVLFSFMMKTKRRSDVQTQTLKRKEYIWYMGILSHFEIPQRIELSLLFLFNVYLICLECYSLVECDLIAPKRIGVQELGLFHIFAVHTPSLDLCS